MSSSLGYSGNTPILGLDVVSWLACSSVCCTHVTCVAHLAAKVCHDQS